MLKGSLHIDENDPNFSKIRALFLRHYELLLHKETTYFPGMCDVLAYLDQKNIPWGIVTNKPGYLTEPLMASFKLDARCCCIISGDTLPYKKPNPAPLLHACQLTKANPKKSIYVGDTESDVQAAKAAGMKAIAVLYGYHDPKSQPEFWGADYVVEQALQILDSLLRS